MAPTSTSRSSESFDFENLRIETSGPSTPIGRIAQLKREPSRRRASQSGLEFVDAPTDRRDDLLDDAQEVRLVLEQRRHRLEQAAPLDEDVVVTVDEDVGDRRILEERFERAKPGHLVHDLGDERVELLGVRARRRSATTHCVMMPWISLRRSASGSFSSAARLSSSIRRRWRRTLASRILSLSATCATCSGGLRGSGHRRRRLRRLGRRRRRSGRRIGLLQTEQRRRRRSAFGRARHGRRSDQACTRHSMSSCRKTGLRTRPYSAAIWLKMILRRSVETLLPALISSRGRPRSIASRTSL